jgi:hypothetical protein
MHKVEVRIPDGDPVVDLGELIIPTARISDFSEIRPLLLLIVILLLLLIATVDSVVQ